MITNTFNDFRAHALSLSGRECCGLIIDGPERYVPCRNSHTFPESNFVINPEDYAKAKDAGYTIMAVCHSHVGSCRPTQNDRVACERLRIPFYILGSDGMWRIDSNDYRSRLVGRPFRFAWADCYSLVRDYFGGMRDYARDEESAGRLYWENFEVEGWYQVALSELQKNDVILTKSPGHYLPDHAMIYLGNGKVLHHRTGHLSKENYLDFNTIKQTAAVLRRA